MAEVSASFANISIANASGSSPGSFRITGSGMQWKAAQGEKRIDVPKSDITELVWTKTTKGCQLAATTDEKTFMFQGFRDSDAAAVKDACDKGLGRVVKDGVMAVSGRNWGSAKLIATQLQLQVDGRPAVQVDLQDIQDAKVDNGTDVHLTFNADNVLPRCDALTEIMFHVPNNADDFSVGDDDNTPALRMLEAIRAANPEVSMADQGEAVAAFEEVRALAPRGNYSVEMHLGFMKLAGAVDFVVRYQSVSRIFVLPKNPQNFTAVVIALDPPVRKGATYYPYILFQFPTDDEIELDLNIDAAQLEAKRAKCDGKLDAHYDGRTFDVFAKVLRGLSASRIVKPSAFRAADGDAYSLRCIFKSDQGLLFPLERGFFYVDRPPMLVLYDDIESVQFARQALDVASRNSKTFDLVLFMKSGGDIQFRNIAREEWSNLLDYMEAKKIRVQDLAQAKAGPGAMAGTMREVDLDLGDDDDDSDEEDEDFQGGGEEESESDGGSDDDDASDDDVKIVKEKTEKKDKGKKDKKDKKEKKRKKEKDTEDDGGGKKKKAKKEKDPNAPKKPMTSYLYFSNASRDAVKGENPGASLGEISKLLGERWKALAPEDRQAWEDKARQDKIRYERELRAYKEGNQRAMAKDEEGAAVEVEDD